MTRAGFPIRKSSDLSSVYSSPRLIAASYVLHRLLVPRHPPCALINLTTKMLASTVQFSRYKHTTHQQHHLPTTTHSSRSDCVGLASCAACSTETTNPHPNCGQASKTLSQGHHHVCSFRTQQRTYNHLPNPSPVPTGKPAVLDTKDHLDD